ncbi:hypothetical protein KTE65_02965 [Burkholderia multivorans]|nr:hypothetical protein [Burkholderia multivorans]
MAISLCLAHKSSDRLPDGDLSLTAGRANYRSFGASRRQDLPHVRRPLPDEMPDGE